MTTTDQALGNIDRLLIVDLNRIILVSRSSDVSSSDNSPFEVLSIFGQQFLRWDLPILDLNSSAPTREALHAQLKVIKELDLSLALTGSGIEVHKALLETLFGGEAAFSQVPRLKQMSGLTRGLQKILRENSDQFYSLKPQLLNNISAIKYKPEHKLESGIVFPLVLITIKDGISFYRWESPESEPKKIISSILGESSLLGFVNLIRSEGKETQTSIQDILVRASSVGDNRKVDLTVGDIYGDGISQVANLDKNILASSMGKSAKELAEDVRDEDYIYSMILMLGINLGNIGALVVSRFYAGFDPS